MYRVGRSRNAGGVKQTGRGVAAPATPDARSR